MFRILLKKQILELGTFYLLDKKTGKRRSRKGMFLIGGLFVLLFGMLGFSFFMIASEFAKGFVAGGMGWLYFAIMGIFAVCLGVFGSVFNTYAGLYHAKDNEMLLSMPIPPRMILFARMVGVWLMGLLFEGIVFIPVIVAYFVYGNPSVLAVVFSVLMFFVLSVVITVLTCALGWVVALISSKLKNKSIVTTILSLALFAVYYVFWFNLSPILNSLMENSEAVGKKVKGFAYLFYLLGKACVGDGLSMLIFTLIAGALLALTLWLLSATFLRIALTKTESKKAEFRKDAVRSSSVGMSLYRREWKRYLSSATYMLNCSIGTLFMLALSVILVIMRSKIAALFPMIEALGKAIPGMGAIFPLAIIVVGSMLIAANDLTAPSISLEGKHIWILQSLPVEGLRVFRAKEFLYLTLTLPPVLIVAVCASVIFRVEFPVAFLLVIYLIIYTIFFGRAGLAINLKLPNMTWTNEVVPVKQGASVVIALFGGWAVSILIGVGGFFAMKIMRIDTYLSILIVIFAASARLLDGWLRGKGSKIFAEL